MLNYTWLEFDDKHLVLDYEPHAANAHFRCQRGCLLISLDECTFSEIAYVYTYILRWVYVFTFQRGCPIYTSTSNRFQIGLGQTSLNVNWFETGLSASVNGALDECMFYFPNLQEIVLLVILVLGAAGVIYMFFALELSHYLASMFKSRRAW